MDKITWNDIVRKLTSRKFWMAIALFVSGVFTAMGAVEKSETITGLIMQGAAVIAYIVGEGFTDAKACAYPTIEENYFADGEIDTAD